MELLFTDKKNDMKSNLIYLSLLLLSSLLMVSCGSKSKEQELIPISKKALSDSTSIYYADFDSFPKEKSLLPIGIIDDTPDGIQVVKMFLHSDQYDNITGKLTGDGIPDFAGENYIFLSDNANAPYSNYVEKGKADYLRELVVRDALFLLRDHYFNIVYDQKPTGVKEHSKILVVASSSASVTALKDIEILLQKSETGVKVISLINCGVSDMLASLDSAKESFIGLLATPTVTFSGDYERVISDLSVSKGFKGKIRLYSETVEDFEKGDSLGFKFDQSPSDFARYHLISLIEKHRMDGNKNPLKGVILGSPIFSHIADSLKMVINDLLNFKKEGVYIYKNIIDENFTFYDPVTSTTRECYRILRESDELSMRLERSVVTSFISVPIHGLSLEQMDEFGNLSDKFKYGREVGSDNLTTKIVPFSPESYVLIKK